MVFHGPAVIAGLDALAPIGLEVLDDASMTPPRTSRKHLVRRALVDTVLARLEATHAALEVDGVRAFAHDTVYFDTPELGVVRAYAHGRPARFRVRTRLYADTGVCAFELKHRTPAGGIERLRLRCDTTAHGRLTPAAEGFLAEYLGAVPAVAPVVQATYTRVTLAGAGEQVKIDVDLAYGRARLRPEWAIVETSSASGEGPGEQVLRALGSRPVALSKYVMGAALTVLPAPPADLRGLARWCFTTGP
jgi:hypothetical protein